MASDDWDRRLRRRLKDQHGFGLRLREKNGKTQFALRSTEGIGEYVVLPFAFHPSNQEAISAAIAHLLATMREQGITLREAHRRCFPTGAVSQEKTQALIRGIDHIEWELIAQAFLDSRRDNRVTTRRDTACRIQKALEVLRSKPLPRDGASLMRAYASRHFSEAPEGGQGRKRHLVDVAAFLRFAVQERGVPAVWLPLEGHKREALVGSRDRADEELTVPIKPAQFVALLDALERDAKPELRLAVALVGFFGLRPAELAVMKVQGRELRVGSGVKRNPRTKKTPRPPRLVLGLDLEGRAGEADATLRLLESGLVKLPGAVRTQIDKCVGPRGDVIGASLKPVGDAFRQLLDRYEFWQSLVAENPGLTPYSLRHGYAWRAHMCGDRPMSIRVAAALMGHDPKTHQKHYGCWVDEEGIRGDVARWRGADMAQLAGGVLGA